jgi:polysaccharide biosynthesis protein PslH
MKILWVKAGKLLPLNTGGRIRSYNILRQLAARQEVTLLSYYGGQRDKSYEDEIQQHFPATVSLCTAGTGSTSLRGVLHYFCHLWVPAPYAVTKFTHRAVRRLLRAWLTNHLFDVAVCDFLSASLNFPDFLATPTVLFQHNVESALWHRQAARETSWVKKLAFQLEAVKMQRYEHAALQRFHHIVAVSEHDLGLMSKMTDRSRITVVPTGVDLLQYRLPEQPKTCGRLVMFTGSMDWEANIDAVDFFCRQIWPLVQARVPDARLRIVGRDPHPRIRALGRDSIEVTGTVPSVIDHLKQAAVVVVPLRIGGGTRLKIYEAMAMGKPVVCTSIGAEGLDVHPGRDILLADDAARFADSVVMLLLDESLCRRYGIAATESAGRHDWPVVAEGFAHVLERVKRLKGAAHQTVPAAAPCGPLEL